MNEVPWIVDKKKGWQGDHHVTQSLCSRGFTDFVNWCKMVAEALKSYGDIQKEFYIKFWI